MRTSSLLLRAFLMTLCLAGAASAEDTLYARLGERAGIAAIVDAAVGLILADDRVKDDFDNINLVRLKQRITDQLCMIADGPCVYKGRPMAASHRGLDVNQAKFNAVTEDLQSAMARAGIPYRTQNRLIARLAPMQRDIVTQ